MKIHWAMLGRFGGTRLGREGGLKVGSLGDMGLDLEVRHDVRRLTGSAVCRDDGVQLDNGFIVAHSTCENSMKTEECLSLDTGFTVFIVIFVCICIFFCFVCVCVCVRVCVGTRVCVCLLWHERHCTSAIAHVVHVNSCPALEKRLAVCWR